MMNRNDSKRQNVVMNGSSSHITQWLMSWKHKTEIQPWFDLHRFPGSQGTYQFPFATFSTMTFPFLHFFNITLTLEFPPQLQYFWNNLHKLLNKNYGLPQRNVRSFGIFPLFHFYFWSYHLLICIISNFIKPIIFMC